ncbi:response regulator [Massilia sp. PAMC28688]|uniref:hybrid sensor histidine kinase/response regulator n=1 Tax=Massilia sp. PAMC28688 TaxID=2861283 RepID=UPI001C63A50F|nr:ATP-binding protein [Massilia sp. PAMC28688]QYF92928.1 response regulator [Massilia sp. PAMC28688]
MHIRTYLYMMAAAILLPVIVLSGVALRMLQQAERDAALGALAETANSFALLVDSELYSAEASLRVLAASPSLARGDYAALRVQATAAGPGRHEWLVLLDASGHELLSTARAPGRPKVPLADAAAMRAPLAQGKTVVSNLARSAPDKLVSAVNVPVRLPDGRAYILSHAFASEHFMSLMQEIRAPQGWLMGIIDANGNFVARNVDARNRLGTQARPELVAAMRATARGRIRHRALEGTEVYSVFGRSSMSGWSVAVAAPVALIDRSARNATLVAAGGLLAALLCAFVVTALFGRQHVRSIQRAMHAARGLGNGIPPAPTHSRVVEVDQLHQALHAAGEQLLQAHAYRKHAETERQSLLEGEQKARVMAEQQNSAKDQFLAMLGHELRNPLAPISTAAQLLRLQSPDAARVRYASDVIARQVDHMNSLLGDLLDVSRVTRGLVALNVEQVDLKSIIERALEQTAALVGVKEHQLRVTLPDQPVLLHGDKARLIQIFANLINNAAKYTPAGGKIALAATLAPASVVLTISDNGEGFSDKLLPRIFDLFSQGERTPDRSQGGLGLGLALVQSLVKLHGGSVSAFSAGPGQGSVFTVTLPYAPHAAAPPAPARPSRPAPQRLGIMIVDDNIDGAISLSLFLEEAGGHRVSTYYDASTALASAAREAPEVFILDIGLPDFTGYELARRLRAMPQFAEALFIALTGYGQPQDKQAALDAGFDHHVAKPADPQTILGLVGRLAQQA